MNDRARVPFALAGVALLVGSAAFSAALGPQSPVTEPRTEVAIEEARSDAVTALRSAARSAAREAARNPVVTPANTTAGRELGDETPFRDYLALRLYTDYRERIRSQVSNAEPGVSVTARLPPTPNGSALARARDRVAVRRADANGTAMSVTVKNVMLVASRGERVVERVELSPTVTVASPVLLLHDRTTRFDARLDRPPTEPGLSRRLSARLYALAWSRGYAQYGGAPVSNVIANRHVEVATNHALLAEQRAVFGRADPAGRRAVRTAAARTLGTDVLTASGYSSTQAGVLLEAVDDTVPNSSTEPVDAFERGPEPDDRLRVRVNSTADGAYRSFIAGHLQRTVDGVYGATAALQMTARRVSVSHSEGDPPGQGWRLVDERRTTRTDVDPRSGNEVERTDDGHLLDSHARRVVRRTVTTRRWQRDNDSRTTRSRTQAVFHVDIAVVGRHAPSDDVPAHPVRTVHERGAGALDGPNLAGVERRAVDRLVVDRGGVDALARRAVVGSVDESPVRISGVRPDGLLTWVSRDLRTLRRRVANVSVTVERGAVGTYEVNPAAELAAELRARRGELVDVPTAYDGTASKARYAARAAYLDAVIETLEQRAARRDGVKNRVADQLADRGISMEQLRSAADAERDTPSRHRTVEGVGPPTRLAVEGGPPYLTLTAVDRARLDVRGAGRYRGLAARNVNVFAAPYGDAVDAVAEGLFPGDRSRLRSAASALRAAEALPAAVTDDELRAQRSSLRTTVVAAVADRRAVFRARLALANVGASTADRRAVVTEGLSRWSTPAGRALALANGSAADAVARTAAERYPERLSTVKRRDGLRLSLRAAARGGDGVPQPVVDRTTNAVRDVSGSVARSTAEEAIASRVDASVDGARARLERRLGRSLARVPAGVPLAPVPTSWYATANFWIVETKGEYARFTVRANRGVPGRSLRYVRDGRLVRFDWDGDGTPETVGRADRVDARAKTGVVVVVPPGGRGVGDTSGNADERSAGWNAALT